MNKVLGTLIVFVCFTTAIFADSERVPEIDASSGATALALISGALLVLRSRRKQ